MDGKASPTWSSCKSVSVAVPSFVEYGCEAQALAAPVCVDAVPGGEVVDAPVLADLLKA